MSTTNPDDALILSWRSEYASALEEFQKAIPSLQSAYEATAEAVREASTRYQRVIRRLLKPVHTQSGTRYESPESANNQKLDELRIEVDQAKSLAARARADLEAARLEAERLKASIRQIDRAIPIETEVAA